jgi:hypothetical protein
MRFLRIQLEKQSAGVIGHPAHARHGQRTTGNKQFPQKLKKLRSQKEKARRELSVGNRDKAEKVKREIQSRIRAD